MAFDGLHVIWTTYGAWQPHDARGNWAALRELYLNLEKDRCGFESSASLPKYIGNPNSENTLTLSPDEQVEVLSSLLLLMAPHGDRIAGNLPVLACSVSPTSVSLPFVPAKEEHSQIIGRLKSKTASRLLRLPERHGQKRIWSHGYWFAGINGAVGIARVEHFLRA